MDKFRRGLMLLFLVMGATLIAGCGGSKEADSGDTEQDREAGKGYKDGIYFAQADSFAKGWKYIAVLEVEDGKIVSAEWNGAPADGGTDKKTRSQSGAYGMVEKGGAMAPWYEQAEAAEAYLLEVQDPYAIEYDEDGRVDAISGASIHVNEFIDLARKALSGEPNGLGPYKDGAYYAEQPVFSEKTGWKYNVSISVIGGRIVSVNWNGEHKDGGKDKKTMSKDGEYGMVEKGGAMAPWYEQAMAVEAYLLEVQDPAEIEYDEKGNADAISGATIHVNDFAELAKEALADAK